MILNRRLMLPQRLPLRLTFVALAPLVALATSFAAGLAQARPFVPADDAVVVAQVPGSQRGGGRALRARSRQEPANLPLALQLARAGVERARQLGDPRELGAAQAALAPWWQEPLAPPPVRLLRASIRQSQHDFAGALKDLDSLIAPVVMPAADRHTVPLAVSAQALLSRAGVHQVQGRYTQAAHDCRALLAPGFAALGAAPRWHAEVCLAELDSLQGHHAQASAALQRLAAAPQADPGWLALVQAEGAERRGDAAAATAAYHLALRARDDVYTRAALADHLLDQRRATEVLTLLDGRSEADALLLRLVLAARQARDPRAADWAALLQQRFDAARERGDSLHAREEARFALAVGAQPQRALALAQQNWRAQREPADARLLLDAARAAGQPAAAEPVQQFLRESGLRDVRLAPVSVPITAPAPVQARLKAAVSASTSSSTSARDAS